MNVQQLIDQLVALNKPDLPVGVYCEIAEDANPANGVGIYTPETHPYCKGDNCFSFDEIEGKEIVLIS